MPTPLSFLLIEAARAGALVVFAGDPDVAVHRVAADAGVPVWELDPVPVTDLFQGGAPVAIGAGQPAGCASGPVTNAQIRETVTRVEARIAYQEQYEQALAEIDAAAVSLVCLSEPAEASLGGRLFFLQGVAAAGLDSNESSRAAFAHALAFQPALTWDDKFSPKLRGPFDEASAASSSTPTQSVLLGPGFEDTESLWIDGRMVHPTGGKLTLPEGPHLAQVIGTNVVTVAFVAGARPAALVLPAELSNRVLAEVDTPAAQVLVQALLDEYLPPDATTYVWSGSRTWRTGTWEALAPSDVLVQQQRHALGTRMVVAGGVAGGLSAIATVAGLGLWAANHSSSGAETTEEYGARMARTGAGSALFDAGLVGVGVGLGCVTFGVVW